MASRRDTALDNNWSALYQCAGISALFSFILVPLQLIIFISSPPPTTALEWFELFHRNELLGLLSFEFLIIIGNILAIPLYLAFYAALRRTNESIMLIATVFGLIGAVAFFASRPAFDMMYLGGKYYDAMAQSDKAMILAAGEAVYASFHGTLSHLGYVFMAVAPALISVVMMRSGIFSKATAYMGILSNLISLGIYIPEIGIYLGIVSCFPLIMIWYIMLARGFFRLSRSLKLR